MPASHTWEIDIEGQTIEASKADVKKLAASAKAAGKQFTVFENGEPVTSKTTKQIDTFKHEMFVDLSKVGYSVVSLTREFDNGMEDEELLEELSELSAKLNHLYEKTRQRIGEKQDNALYGPQIPVGA